MVPYRQCRQVIRVHRRRRCREVVRIFIFFSLLTTCVIFFLFAKRAITPAGKTSKSDAAKIVRKPPVAVPMSEMKFEKQITHQLWQFTEDEAERVYFYKHFLQSPWSANATNLEKWRSELKESTGNMSTDTEFIATQMNVAENKSLVYYLHKKPKRGQVKHYKATLKFIRKLPKVSPLQNKRFKRCSLIGNSGLIKGSRCGKEIDDADFVFRCNAAPLQPFKEDAGTKSNITTLNPSIFSSRFSSLKKAENVSSFVKMASQYNGYLLIPCFGVDVYLGVCLKISDIYNATDPLLAFGHPDHFAAIWNFWKRRKFGNARPSSGFYLLHVALAVCEETHLYGFWPFASQLDTMAEGGVHNVPYHYFDRLSFSKVHDMKREFLILLQMHRLGLLQMHVGNCS